MNPDFPEVLYVGGSSLEVNTEESWESIQRDPRGLVLIWEPPQKSARYVMGLDPTEGITGWTRAAKTAGDYKTDNGVIEIIKVDGDFTLMWKIEGGVKVPEIDPETKRQRRLYRDVQVLEFAAPCDAIEIARIANVLGRIYCGDADEQCELIHEAWPGCGMLTTQELLRIGYSNLFFWEYIDSVAEQTNRIGWRSTRDSQRLLWTRSRRHYMKEQVLVRSQFLLKELVDAEVDVEKMRAKAAYGCHDDRMQAFNMALWASRRWTYDIETTHEPVTTTPSPDFQRYAPTLDDNLSYSEWRESATADWD